MSAIPGADRRANPGDRRQAAVTRHSKANRLSSVVSDPLTRQASASTEVPPFAQLRCKSAFRIPHRPSGQLLNALLLCPVYVQQRFKDSRKQFPGISAFDQRNQIPQRSFTSCFRRYQFSAKTPTKALTEELLVKPIDSLVIEVVVAVRIDHAVTENGRR